MLQCCNVAMLQCCNVAMLQWLPWHFQHGNYHHLARSFQRGKFQRGNFNVEFSTWNFQRGIFNVEFSTWNVPKRCNVATLQRGT
jgi:hypothetical protein